MFIKLTLGSGSKIRLHIYNIVSYQENLALTLVTCHSNYYSVSETPEEIDRLLNECYITIKG